MIRKIRFYYFAPHPVQYHYGIYKELAKFNNLDFRVIYEDDIGLKPIYVEEFKQEIKWDIDLLSGYPYEFMKNYGNPKKEGFFARVNFSIFKKLLIDKPDVILFKTYTNFSDWLIMFLTRFTKIKIIFRGEATLKGNEGKTLKSKIKEKVLKWWLKNCDIVMYSCTGNKEYWKYYGVRENKMLPIPCAVDNDFFQSERKKYLGKEKEIRKELGIDENDFVIVYVSRFNKNKNIETLIKSVGIINNKNISLLLVGDGSEMNNLKLLSKKYNVKSIFVGFKNQNEIPKYYSIANLFILLSKDFENSPKVLNEAMNFELPVIVTKIAGTAEDLVFDNVNGFKVDPLNVDDIAQKINYLNKNREITKQMGKKSLEIVNNWTFEKDAYYINEAIQRVIKK